MANVVFSVFVLILAATQALSQTTQPIYTPLPATQPGAATTAPAAVVQVEPIADSLRTEYRINPFYTKCAMIQGIPIVASDKVSDYAMLECAWTLDHLLNGRTMPLEALHRSKVRIAVIAVTQYTMDLPENQNSRMTARAAYNDRRSRGLGGLPMASCAEENLLNLAGDPYVRENITIHEFSHTVASAIRRMQPEWYDRLREAYAQAKASGNYGDSYAISNEQEYWAEGAQCWFNCAHSGHAGGAATRDQLKAKDPALAALLNEVYGDGPWRYTKTTARPADQLAHLAGMDRSKFPVFRFSNSPRIQAAATTQPGGSRLGPTSAPATQPTPAKT
jgi:hypothetical protein